ncbi:hypothetical protein CBF34_02390 [Vagococcus penaei]|uniref:Uncharacterized protein n=1 Tax=Vagococcus penaei TaxID=633807 RepID=A0A1Q2D824_9ENTE|nr:bifunctional UDP-sugar hydrolase/5'-nucleotidase [Vagococcus penaei]AQP54470.1 hypothetical protein BW732_09695 [Vagococcus penaei]RSU06389.1 hypothetical protein CBF34_02390 [Vagococcus penaei]
MTKKIHFIHTNDIHSHFERWPKIRRMIQEQKIAAKSSGIDCITVDVGDFMDRNHPLTESTHGRANVRLMNQAHYDAVTIGNNEGITNSYQQLNALYDRKNFPVILSNLLDSKSLVTPKWAESYRIITTESGLRIGLIGLTAPMELTYQTYGWTLVDIKDVLDSLLPLLRPQVDCLILLSHLGLPDDKLIAENYPMIDIIFGSHTHHLLENGLIWNDVMLVAAGRFGEYVGLVEVTYPDSNKQEISAVTYCVDDLPNVASDLEEVEMLQQLGIDNLTNQVITQLPKTLYRENTLIDCTLKAMKEAGNSSIALINSGLFLKDLKKGPVTALDLHQCLPHPMNLISVRLMGSDLIRLMKEIEKNRAFLRNFPIIGLKFRGKVFGEMCYDGINYDHVSKQVTHEGKQIQLDKVYQLVTVDHIMFVPFFPTIEIAGNVKLIGSDFLRNVLGDYLSRVNSLKKKDDLG